MELNKLNPIFFSNLQLERYFISSQMCFLILEKSITPQELEVFQAYMHESNDISDSDRNLLIESFISLMENNNKNDSCKSHLPDSLKVPKSMLSNLNKDGIMYIQRTLNDLYNCDLFVDGILGPLTIKAYIDHSVNEIL